MGLMVTGSNLSVLFRSIKEGVSWLTTIMRSTTTALRRRQAKKCVWFWLLVQCGLHEELYISFRVRPIRKWRGLTLSFSKRNPCIKRSTTSCWRCATSRLCDVLGPRCHFQVLPATYDSRITFYVDTLQTLFNSQSIHQAESSKVSFTSISPIRWTKRLRLQGSTDG